MSEHILLSAVPELPFLLATHGSKCHLKKQMSCNLFCWFTGRKAACLAQRPVLLDTCDRHTGVVVI